MKTRQQNSAIHYALDTVLTVTQSDIKNLVAQVKNTPQGRIRLCTHASPDSVVQEMIIILDKNSKIRPHKHLQKTESFHIIAGECDIVLFNDTGSVKQKITMGDYQSGKCFYYRLLDPMFHTVIVRSEYVIFQETTQGPYDSAETIYANWLF